MHIADGNKLLDSMIGAKMRERRRALALTQSELGEILSISYQQVQRYESGENAISLQRLLEIANALNVKPDYFLEQAVQIRAAPREKEVIEKLDRPLRILLVEDSSADEILLREALKQIDIPTELYHVSQSDKVIALLQSPANGRFHPDLILLDINMPRMSGLELLKKIKQHETLKTLPVVVLTNSIRAKDMLTAYRHHANGFVQKSTNIHEFYQDIDRIVGYWSRTAILPSH